MAKKDAAQPEQRYACDRPGCDKSYSRPDHLLRHKLNHDVDRVLCCNQCDRTFVRQDLLVRHLERHALRGKTLGRWSNKGKDKPPGEGSSSSKPKRARRGSKAARMSHEVEDSDSENDYLDPALSGPGQDADISDFDGSAIGTGSFERYQAGPSAYGDLADTGPSPSTWGQSGYPGATPLDLSASSSAHHSSQHPGAALTAHGAGAYPPQSQWSPQAASNSSVAGAGMSPSFRRTGSNMQYYGDGGRNGGPSPADLLSYDGGSASGSGRGPAGGSQGASGSNTGARPQDGRSAEYDDFAGGRNPPPPQWEDGGFPPSADRQMGDVPPDVGDDPSSFRWLGAAELGAAAGGDGNVGGDPGIAGGHGRQSGGSYAPPPSGAYYAGWPESNAGPGDPALQRSDSAADPVAVEGGDPASSNVAPGGSARLLPVPIPPLANQDIFPFAPPAIDHTADYGWLFDGMDPFGSSSAFPGFGRFEASRGQSQASGFSPSSSDGLGGFLGSFGGGSQNGGNSVGGGNGGGRHGGGETASFGRGMSSDGFMMSGSEAEPPNALEDLAYFASLQAEIPSRVTYHVDPVAHHRLLVFLSSVSELPNSPLFTPSALRCYIYLFFAKFNRLYPLLHEPTFAASTTDPMLLSAVVVIGAHFAALPAHEMAVRIAQKIWGAIVSLEDFRPARATLPMLQAMVLTECFGKMMSSRPQHEMSHLFHNFIITLARRNAVFNPSASANAVPPSGASYEETEEFWRGWAREEEKKRIALFAFMLDAQHATTFRHIPALSAFQIQLNLPCSDEEWSKVSPDAWMQHRKRTSYKAPSPFISALKACLSPGKTPHELDAFPRFVLLHGLMSIAYDLHWKQNILLGAENNNSFAAVSGGKGGASSSASDLGGIGNWKDRLSSAYSSLQARMDIAYIKAEDDSSARLIHRATPSLVSAAQITLFADTIDIQIYAGLPSVLGRFIDRATFNASRRSVKEWVKTSDGQTAVWHAVNFLRTSLLGSGTEAFGTIQPWKPNHAFAESDLRDRSGDVNSPRREGSPGPGGKKTPDRETGLDEVLHHRWCQYLCALVIWAYGHALATPRGTQPSTAANSRGTSTAPRVNNVPDAPFPLQGPYVSNSRRNAAAAAAPAGPAAPLKPEAVDFLERMSTKSPEGIVSVDCKCYTKSVLELVEKELRGSRWELGREASGVLRKLIANHAMPDWDRSEAGGPGNSSSNSNRNNSHGNSNGRNSNNNAAGGGGGASGQGPSNGGDGFRRPGASASSAAKNKDDGDSGLGSSRQRSGTIGGEFAPSKETGGGGAGGPAMRREDDHQPGGRPAKRERDPEDELDRLLMPPSRRARSPGALQDAGTGSRYDGRDADSSSSNAGGNGNGNSGRPAPQTEPRSSTMGNHGTASDRHPPPQAQRHPRGAGTEGSNAAPPSSTNSSSSGRPMASGSVGLGASSASSGAVLTA